jgi:hypothetical protein
VQAKKSAQFEQFDARRLLPIKSNAFGRDSAYSVKQKGWCEMKLAKGLKITALVLLGLLTVFLLLMGICKRVDHARTGLPRHLHHGECCKIVWMGVMLNISREKRSGCYRKPDLLFSGH